MLTIKIEWKSDFFPNYSVYTADKYTVSRVSATGSDPSKNGDYLQLLLTTAGNELTDIHIGKGSVAYVMNANGATVDRIYLRD